MCGFNAKKLNDYIIVKGKPGWQYSNLLKSYPLLNYDVMLNTDVGLKSFEGFMGNDIRETEVPFNLDRKLTDAEIKQTVFIAPMTLNRPYKFLCAERKSSTP